MSQTPPRGGNFFDDNFDDPYELITTVMIGLTFLPVVVGALVPQVRQAVSGWLLEHGVLVAPEAAWVTIPFVGAGLDVRRIVILAVVLIAIAWVGFATAPRRRGRGRRG